MSKSRINNSIRNIVVNISTQVVNYIFRFLTRTIFIQQLGKEVLGLNGLFISILYFLSFSELGISTVVGYLLYKPLANNDKKKISVLMRILRNAYWIIGSFITILGFVCIPFLSFIIKNYEVNLHTYLCFIVFILTSSLSYIFSYKSTLLIIDQKEYIFSLFTLFFCIIQNVLQIICLIQFNSYLYYLIVALVCVLLLNFTISLYVDKKYCYINDYKIVKVDADTKNNIAQLLKASVFNNIGSSILSSSDNVIYSSLFGLAIVGEISNYILICTSFFLLNSKIISAITPSIGNYCAVENKEKQYLLFKSTFLFVFLICSVISICLLSSIQDIITIWIGVDYIISFNIVFLIVFNSFCSSLVAPVYTFQVTCGLAHKLVYKRIYQVIANVILSIVLGLTIGVKGVILATIISFLLTVFWMEPNLVFNEGFNISPKKYYNKFFCYIVIFFIDFIVMYFLDIFIDSYIDLSIFRIVIKIMCSIFICIIFCYATTSRLEEHKILKLLFISKLKEFRTKHLI